MGILKKSIFEMTSYTNNTTTGFEEQNFDSEVIFHEFN